MAILKLLAMIKKHIICVPRYVDNINILWQTSWNFKMAAIILHRIESTELYISKLSISPTFWRGFKNFITNVALVRYLILLSRTRDGRPDNVRSSHYPAHDCGYWLHPGTRRALSQPMLLLGHGEQICKLKSYCLMGTLVCTLLYDWLIGRRSY